VSTSAVGPKPGESWQLTDLLSTSPGLVALSDSLDRLVERGYPVVACTADLKYSNGLVRFQEKHPDRFFQFGISEQNMVTASAGMATTGLIPFVATFASFLALLCCEQIRTDVAFTNQRVRLFGHHAGITLGFYGTSHHATEDLAIVRSMANMSVVAPADRFQLAAALAGSIDHPGPIYFRYGRGREPDVYDQTSAWVLGHAIQHGDQREDLCIIATGSMVHPALQAAEVLRADGLSVGVVDMHTIKPLDEQAVLAAAEDAAMLMTVEEHNVLGGLGSAVAEVLTVAAGTPPLHRHGLHDEYSLIGPPTHLYRHYGLDAEGVAAAARTALARAR
jgi:transketolase